MAFVLLGCRDSVGVFYGRRVDPVAWLVGAGLAVLGGVGAWFAARWERRYSQVHPTRRRPNAAIAGRDLPLLFCVFVIAVGVRVVVSQFGLTLLQHLGIGLGFALLLAALLVPFLRWMRDRKKTEATRRVARRVLVAFVVLLALALGFIGS